MKSALLVAALVLGGFAASAGAQTCASPQSWNPSPQGDPVWTGDTCQGGETGLLSLCQAAQDGHGHAYVARITSAAAGTYQNIQITNSGFTAFVGLVPVSAAGACNSDQGGDTGQCVTTGDTATAIQHANVADGEYYLFISNSGVDTATACGSFTLTADGSLPVTLKEFTVI